MNTLFQAEADNELSQDVGPSEEKKAKKTPYTMLLSLILP